jgi:hypothetical protein
MNFSLRKLQQPFPPSPALACTRISSTNFIQAKWPTLRFKSNLNSKAMADLRVE